ncbi:MAG TPA: hypothetical protein VJB15_01990 [Rhodothermia bacterium]|nr:hypothetical protein [Rhodothermia bacterium]
MPRIARGAFIMVGIVLLTSHMPAAAADIIVETDISQTPDSGMYSDATTLEVFYYDSMTQTLTSTGTEVPPRTSTAEQDGHCVYVLGSWDLDGSRQTVSRCISLRSFNGGESLYRIGIRELQGLPMRADLVHLFRDLNGAELGTYTWRHLCPSGVIVRNCQVDEEKPQSAFAEAENVPIGSTEFCPSLKLYQSSHDGSINPEPVLSVVGICRPL